MSTPDGLKLPAIFADHMMLQRDLCDPVWGWAKPGEKVTVAIAGQSAEAVAGSDGKWLLRLAPLAAGGPYEMTVSTGGSQAATTNTGGAQEGKVAGGASAVLAGGRTITIHDVLVGDVWICSGQSNMEFSLGQSNNGQGEAAGARYPQIRHLAVPHVTAKDPQDDVDAAWAVCEPGTAAAFTGVGYFFARKLLTDLGVPIGLLHTSWGGSNCETWCSREVLLGEPSLRYMIDLMDELEGKGPELEDEVKRKLAEWDAAVSYADPGIAPEAAGWAAPDCDVTDWQTMDVPRAWETLPGMNIDGAVWFRKEVDIPAAWAGRDLALDLGAIDDFDTTFVNGVQVGATAMETPNWWSAPRHYTVPAAQVRPGRMVIAVRVFDRMGNGGLVGGGHPMRLAPVGADTGAIRLEGWWHYRIELALEPKPTTGMPAMPAMPGTMNAPCALYNAMIAPFLHFGIKGAIWYQGESNADRGWEYVTLHAAMIRDWRALWGVGDFPFLFVQLANFLPRNPDPAEHGWAELRDAQTQTLDLPNTGMAVIIDIGDAVDIHPRNKQDVGLRLALSAEKVAYGMDVPFSGPIYESMKVEDGKEGGKIRLRFRHVFGGLVGHGGALTGFAIAGADRKFVWAHAAIDGETVVVSSPRVAQPVAVRYAWDANPLCNLYNVAGLPASPFRTDDWPWLSQKK